MNETAAAWWDPPEVDPSEYDTVDQLAALAAPIFGLLAWKWTDGVPDEAALKERIAHHYGRHVEEELEYTDSGRLMLLDQNPHDGTPVLFDGVQVLLRLGELPPVRGDCRERIEPREGMVTVYGFDGEYVGCMGVETWQKLLAAGDANVS